MSGHTTYSIEIEAESGETDYIALDTTLAKVAIGKTKEHAALPENATKNVFLAFRQNAGATGYINSDGSADVTGRAYPKKRMGRPELPPEDRTKPRTIWMSDAEWDKVQSAPKGWVRGMVQRAKVPA